MSGIILTEEEKAKLPPKSARLFHDNPDILKSFLRYYRKKIIRSGFVFQIQPYSTSYSTFVVHVIPSPTGKGNGDITEMLENIKSTANMHKILIQTLAFDGDGCYNLLHQMYYDSYINDVFINSRIKIIQKSKVMRVVTDALHLFKRLRYRLISCRVHAGFKCNSPFIETESLIRLFKFLPTIVFNNEKITKINDNLPLTLFSFETFLILFENSNFIAFAYWLPITLTILALNDNRLSFEWQNFFLEVAFWFLAFYKKSEIEEIQKTNNTLLKQRKRGEDLDVRFYTNEQYTQFIILKCS